MKKKCYIIVLIFLYVTFSFAQESNTILWGDTIFSIPSNGMVDNEGNIIVTATGYYNDSYDYRGIVLKINSDEVQSYYIHSQHEDTATMYLHITQLDNGNYLCIGAYRTGVEIDVPLPLFFTLLDTNLMLIDEKSFYLPSGYPTGGGFYSLYESADTLLYAFSARKPTMQYGQWVLGLLRATPEGDTIETEFHEIMLSSPYSEHSCEVGGIVYNSIAGKYLVSAKVGFTQAMIYINKDLSIDTIYFYGNPPAYSYLDQKQGFGYWKDDETFITSSAGILDSKGDLALYAGYLDIYGNIEDYVVLNTTGVQDQAAFNNSIAAANDSTIYVVGHDMCYNCNYLTDVDFIEVFSLNSSLDILGYNIIAGDGYYKSFNVLTNDVGDLIVLGTKNVSDTSYHFNLFVSVTPREELGLATSVEKVEDISLDLKPYPNPARDVIRFPVKNEFLAKGIKLMFYTLTGKTAFGKPISGTGNCVNVDVRNLPLGTYIYEIIFDNQKINSGEFIKF